MLKLSARKLKVIATLSSVALFATAFTPGGCTINVDEDLLNQLGGLFSSGSGQGGFDGPGGGFGGPGGWGGGDCPSGNENENADDCDSPWTGPWDHDDEGDED